MFDSLPIDSCSKEELISNSFPMPLFLRYTDTEESWLRHRFRQFQVSIS
jgi:hypothetical protein